MSDQSARYRDLMDAAQQIACIAWEGELAKRENAAKARERRDPIPLPIVCRMARERAEAIEFVEVDIEVDE